MKQLGILLSVVGLGACATSSGTPSLDELVRGPARICFDQSAFTLPGNGTIVEAERGRIGTHLTGSMGPHAFEITESRDFAAPSDAGETVYRGGTFHVRRIGTLPGSYAVYPGATEGAQQPIVRIEHFFGTESITFDGFFAGFDPAGAARGGCDRTFRYGA